MKYDASLVGKRVKVLWKMEKSWYPGVVAAYDANGQEGGYHRILYDDGDHEWVEFPEPTIVFLDDPPSNPGKITPAKAGPSGLKPSKPGPSGKTTPAKPNPSGLKPSKPGPSGKTTPAKLSPSGLKPSKPGPSGLKRKAALVKKGEPEDSNSSPSAAPVAKRRAASPSTLNKKPAKTVAMPKAKAEKRAAMTPAELRTLKYTAAQALLEKRGANMRGSLNYGGTLLHDCAYNDQKDIAEMLLDFGISVDSLDWHDFTPILEASSVGYTAMVEILLDRGAAVDGFRRPFSSIIPSSKNPKTWMTRAPHFTGLGLAVFNLHHECALLLMDRGADVNRKQSRLCEVECSPLAIAVAAAEPELVKALLEHGASVDAMVCLPGACDAFKEGACSCTQDTKCTTCTDGSPPTILGLASRPSDFDSVEMVTMMRMFDPPRYREKMINSSPHDAERIVGTLLAYNAPLPATLSASNIYSTNILKMLKEARDADGDQ